MTIKTPLLKYYLYYNDDNFLDRVHFAIIKLSNGNIESLKSAVNMAKKDWRDLLVCAEFATDVKAHITWADTTLYKYFFGGTILVTYKRTAFNLIKSLLIAPLPPAAVGLILLWLLQFFDKLWLFVAMVIAVIAIFVFMLYNAIFSDNIRFEITDDGMLNYYQMGKLKKSFDLSVSDCGYRLVQDANGGTDSLRLRITNAESGSTEIIHCEPLGRRQFSEMFEKLQSFSTVEPEHLN